MKNETSKQTQFATSSDGTQIAYDVTGTGSTLILLHGWGQTRQNWHEVGYVERLKNDFQIITLDIRGNGESDKPIEVRAYTTDKLGQDILAVADACNAEQFTVWGYSNGGNIGRYLAVQSNRVSQLIVIGFPFGSRALGDFHQFIQSFQVHWQPILKAQAEGTLDVTSLSKDDQEKLQTGTVPLELAWFAAILDWENIAPADLECPTLWLVGSNNENTMASLESYAETLKSTMVEAEVVAGLNHVEEFTEINEVLPMMLAFTEQQDRLVLV